jgi:[ribosomal protein S18]-alanine N-acetyltransferase
MSGMAAPPATPVFASLTHAEVLAAIHRAAFPADEAWSANVMRLQLGLPAAFGFLHLEAGLVLARVAAEESEILTIGVIPARRGAGLGSGLLRAAMDHAALRGATSMFLEVAVTNAPARALYSKFGFQPVGLRRRYYSNGTDALVLRSTLPPELSRNTLP